MDLISALAQRGGSGGFVPLVHIQNIVNIYVQNNINNDAN